MTILGLDASFQQIDPLEAWKAGYRYVLRYLSDYSGKNLTPTERDAWHAAGFGIYLVWENGAGDIKDATTGTAAGQHANQQADALGMPKYLPLYYAFDYDVQPADVPGALAGLEAIKQLGLRPVAAYGGLRLVNAAGQDGFPNDWQAEAWSGTAISNYAAIYQRIIPTLNLPGGGYDEDVIIRPVGAWFKDPTPVAVVVPPPLPPTKEADVAVLVQIPANAPGFDGRIWITNGIHRRWVTGPTDLQDMVYRGLCMGSTSPTDVNVQPISQESLNALVEVHS